MSVLANLSVQRETLGNKELQTGSPFTFIEGIRRVTRDEIREWNVGIAAYAFEPGRLPYLFVGKRIMFHCDQDCYLRFNNRRAAPILLPANTYMSFDVATGVVYYQQVTTRGELRMWIQG